MFGKPLCHPNDPFYAKNLCRKCYYKQYRDINQPSKKYYHKNKAACQLQQKDWRKRNRQKLTVYQKSLYQTNINSKIRHCLSSRVRIALIAQRQKKQLGCIEITGCSIKELKCHLKQKFQQRMTWKNYGKWHIDHIIPCKSFNLSKLNEQKKCFHYTNLQPLWAFDNQHKGSKLC